MQVEELISRRRSLPVIDAGELKADIDRMIDRELWRAHGVLENSTLIDLAGPGPSSLPSDPRAADTYPALSGLDHCLYAARSSRICTASRAAVTPASGSMTEEISVRLVSCRARTFSSMVCADTSR